MKSKTYIFHMQICIIWIFIHGCNSADTQPHSANPISTVEIPDPHHNESTNNDTAKITLTSDEEIIRNNFISTKSISSAKENIIVEYLPNAKGENSLGVYRIIVNEHIKKNIYIAKVCLGSHEPDFYAKDQQIIQKFNELALRENYPYFVRYEGAFKIPQNIFKQEFKTLALKQKKLADSSGYDSSNNDVSVLLLEQARGQDLDSFIAKAYETMTLDELKKTFEKIGHSIGNLHSYDSKITIQNKVRHVTGYIHGDLTLGNIFYDPDSQKISLIDYIGFSKSERVEVILGDFIKSGIAEGLKTLIKNCSSREQAIKIKTILEATQDGVEKPFSDSAQKLALVRYYVRNALPDFLKEFLKKYFKENELPDYKKILQDFNNTAQVS